MFASFFLRVFPYKKRMIFLAGKLLYSVIEQLDKTTVAQAGSFCKGNILDHSVSVVSLFLYIHLYLNILCVYMYFYVCMYKHQIGILGSRGLGVNFELPCAFECPFVSILLEPLSALLNMLNGLGSLAGC